MTGAIDFTSLSGREPLRVVELKQPRCVNRFGTSPCTATGTPKCYQTWTTCKDRSNFNSAGGSIKWRFVESRVHISAFGDYSDADNVATDGLPGLVSVSESSSELNIAGILQGKSPLGIRAGCTVTLDDFPFSDFVGDFYLADRTLGEATFWEKWQARNKFYAGMYLRVYDGYNGQRLQDMRQRLYVVESVDGPNNGQVTITGRDPLRLTAKNKAEFPRQVDIELVADVTAAATSIEVFAATETDLTDSFGNTPEKYLRLGDELICYTGITENAPGRYSLNGVERGCLSTTPEAGRAEQQLQRAGYYRNQYIWKIAADLIKSHTAIPNGFVNEAAWDAEAASYLAQFIVSGVVAEPTAVESLLGELCQQGQFSIWWDEELQTIPLIVVQPPVSAVPLLTDSANILSDPQKVRLPDESVTRATVRYAPFSPTGRLQDAADFEKVHSRIDGDSENANARDAILQRVVNSRWLLTLTQALSVTRRILDNYRDIPEQLVLRIDAKDSNAMIGDVYDVQTEAFKDTEGNLLVTRWQVIAKREIEHGHTYELKMQRFPYVGRFAIIMADGTGSYADATEAEREFGCWLAEDTGLMPDGSEGYLLR